MNRFIKSGVPRFFRLIFVRVIQLSCNFLKVFFYIHFWAIPSKRYELPTFSKPLFQSKKTPTIPKLLWQTNYTKRVTLPVYLNYIWNRILAPTFEYRLFSDEECLTYVKQYFDGPIADAYGRLRVGAAKADFWRVLVLWREGGVYLDVDAALCWPPELIFQEGQSELLIQQNGKITNFYMASSPGNSLMKEIANQILANIQQNTIESVFDMTGPTVVHATVSREGGEVDLARMVSRQGLLTSKIFQYADKPRGHWGVEQQDKKIVQ
jgi:mannosyltransferase OCH1-like enzyme